MKSRARAKSGTRRAETGKNLRRVVALVEGLGKRRWQRHYTVVPIYGVRLHLILAENEDAMIGARIDLEGTFGPYKAAPPRRAFCDTDRGDFGLFFDKEYLTRGVIAHEVAHCGLRIMEWIGHTVLPDDEPLPYLVEWLTEWVERYVKDLKMQRPAPGGPR